jgi:hypothetical protein
MRISVEFLNNKSLFFGVKRNKNFLIVQIFIWEYLRTFIRNEILFWVINTGNNSGDDYAQEWW